MTRFMALILLASCARPTTPPVVAAIPPPPGQEHCQDGLTVPRAPAAPRTVEQLGAWAMRAERAARETERARVQCAADYARLRAWINETR
jgi:hypothetical protein